MEEKFKLTCGVLLIILLLGTADAALVEGLPSSASQQDAGSSDNGSIVYQPTKTPPNPKPQTPNPTGAVRKTTGPNVEDILLQNNFTLADTNENLILRKVVSEDAELHAHVLLLNDDRAGVIAWVQSPNVKKYYLILKEALHSAFTSEVQDLLDETQRREGKPTRNLLTFFDPGLLSERVVFIRVRERLYEFHVAEGSSDVIFELIEDLTE